MSLKDSTELIDGIPAWIECTIYRNDRILPNVIKEYLEEVRTDHSSWQQIPRCMLRHRVIQQCARLAFGISQPDGTFVLTRNNQQRTDKEGFMTHTSRHLGSSNLKELLKTNK